MTIRQVGDTLVVRRGREPDHQPRGLRGQPKDRRQDAGIGGELTAARHLHAQQGAERRAAHPDALSASGRFAATVEPKVIELPQNRVDVVFEINEGAGHGDRDRSASSATRRSATRELREVIRTKQTRMVAIPVVRRYLRSRPSGPRSRAAPALLSVRGLCRFPRAVSAVAELTPDREQLLPDVHDRGGRALQGRTGRGRHPRFRDCKRTR